MGGRKADQRLLNARVSAHTELVDTQLEAERQIRELTDRYERKYTDGQYGQMEMLTAQHQLFHDREHLLYDDAIEKATTALNAEIASLRADVDRFRDDAAKWMSREAFDREHQALTEKMELALAGLSAKIGTEEKVTIRQSAQSELLDRIATNNRWLIGILVTVTIFGITTFLHVLNVI